jgi:hypothetical protein
MLVGSLRGCSAGKKPRDGNLFECMRQDKACYAGADDEDGVPFSS